MIISSMQQTGRVACDTIDIEPNNYYNIIEPLFTAQRLHHMSIQVQSSFNDYDIACKLVRFLRLSAHPGSFINCHSRIERVVTLHSNR